MTGFHRESSDVRHQVFPAPLEVWMKVCTVIVTFRYPSEPIQVQLPLKAGELCVCGEKKWAISNEVDGRILLLWILKLKLLLTFEILR